jgi:hypothetical protein
MTPKEKANDLVNNMFNCDNSTPEKSMAMLLIHAKQCALIAVDEIISIGGHLNFDYAWVEHRPTDTKNWFDTNNSQVIKVNAFIYWVNVRKEIEKL